MTHKRPAKPKAVKAWAAIEHAYDGQYIQLHRICASREACLSGLTPLQRDYIKAIRVEIRPASKKRRAKRG